MASLFIAALEKHHIQVTAIMTLGPGPTFWDFCSGPKTIGIVPPAPRAARVDALKRTSNLAKLANVPLYGQTVDTIRDVANHCKANGQSFLMETGLESPITVLRTIKEAATGNIYVNLDKANLIFHGKGEPVGALDVPGAYLLRLHAKNRVYPTDAQKLSREVAIGQGRVNFPTVIQALKKFSYTGPITIEREIFGPRQEADIRQSKLFLEQLISKSYKKEA